MKRRPDVDVDELAIEHSLWAASEGLRPAEIMSSIGFVPPSMHRATRHDAQLVLTRAWNTLHRETATSE